MSWGLSTYLFRQSSLVARQLDQGPIDDLDCDGTELDAIVGDHLPAEYRQFWPLWSRQPLATALPPDEAGIVLDQDGLID